MMSTEIKMDRRKVRTRQMLRDALIALILEKGYDATTVEDITNRANLGRATFYLHYRDKEDLLVSTLESTFDELAKNLHPISLEGNSTAQAQALIAFQHAAENRDLYRVMLSGQGSGSLIRRVREYLATLIQQRMQMLLQQLPPDAMPIPVEILAQHVAGSLLTLLIWWLENDLPYSAEYMAQVFQQLNGIQAFIARVKSVSIANSTP
jgi:AcrR family transcriptional regulator